MESGKRRACLVWHRRCLGYGTRIALWNGRIKEIQDIQVGDEIVAFDGKELVPDKVVGSWFAGQKDCVRLNDRLTLTKDHRVYTGKDGFKEVMDSSSIICVDEQNVLRSEMVKRLEEVGVCDTFDIETEKHHNFIAEGYVVHNSGKGKTVINFIARSMYQRVGTYFHCFPEYNQGRKVLWEGRGKDGFKYIDHFPKALLAKNPNNTEMKIEYKNGSIFQIIGADTYDSAVGSNPVGIVFDEFSLSDKYQDAWDYFRPMLVENEGWAVFPFTPRGRNHGFDLYQMALNNPEWFCQLLTVDDTGVVDRDTIESERRAGMSEAMILQEFYCSFVSSTENIVIPFELIQASLTRDVSFPSSPRVAGLDVARFGNDRSALVVRRGGEILHVESWGQSDVVQTAGRVIDRYRTGLFDAIAVDSIGVGAGVADILKNNGIPTAMVQVSEKSTKPERFQSQRDELWWEARLWFEEGNCSISKALMENKKQELLKDIQDIHYSYTPSNKIKVESKDEMKKRIKFSPDVGDALCLTFAPKLRQLARDASTGIEKSVSRYAKGFHNWKGKKKDKWDGTYQEFFA